MPRHDGHVRRDIARHGAVEPRIVSHLDLPPAGTEAAIE
jgi:hypothetical protein